MQDNIVKTSVKEGGCLCGQVRYVVTGPLRGVVNCHCSMCQKLHGGMGSHTKAMKKHIHITESRGLAWFKSSKIARRGFCRNCGSSLFWEPFELDATGILAGSVDSPTGLKTIGHIYVSESPDFCLLMDDLPKYSGSSNGKLALDYK